MALKFSITPYFDDFDESNEYYKVLFRPGVSVQTREMNTMQSILQNQVSKVGDHLFKNGSMVIPGQVNYNNKLNYLKVASVSLGYDPDSGDPLTLTDLVDCYITQYADGTGVKAQIVNAIDADPVTGDPITLQLLYTSGNETADLTLTDKVFAAGATVYVAYPLSSSVPDATRTITVSSGSGINGRTIAAGIQKGVYYWNGYFVTVPNSSVVVQKYADDLTAVNVKIGIKFSESVVTVDSTYTQPTSSIIAVTQLTYNAGGDENLYDNAAGTPNFAAPGAHRYKITPSFILADLDDSPENFFELIRVQEGILQTQVIGTQYNILEETLARRTFEESGNYVVDDFKFNIREARINNRGTWAVTQAYQVKDLVQSSVTGFTSKYWECIQAGVSGTGEPANFSFAGIDESTVITDGSVKWRFCANPVSNQGYSKTGSSSNLVTTFGVGRAFVQGYEIFNSANSYVTIPKARDTRTEAKRNINVPQGNYIYINKAYSWGFPDIGAAPQILLYDRFSNNLLNKFGYGNIVGTARINWIENDVRGGLKVSLNNIKMNPGKGFDRDVNRLIVPDPTTSNVTTTSFTNTALVRYAGNSTSSYLQIGGTANFAVSSYSGNGTFTVTGTLTAFASELQLGDVLTFGTAGFATTSSWTITNINAGQSSITISGPSVAGGAVQTSIYVRFSAGTVYGQATGNVAGISTRFQSEYRVGDTIWMVNATNQNTGTVLSITSENRMIVSSTMSSIGTAVSHGNYYSGRTAAFCADIWSNYQLGINARKYTGLFTLSDYSGGTTTVGLHNAVRIIGSNDAKLIQEMAINDYCDINGNRLFITKISSNTVAYGICLDSSVTTGATQYPAFKVNANLQETSSNTLLFPVVNLNAVSSIANNIYTAYKSQAAGGVSLSGNTLTLTLAPPTGSASAEQAITDPSVYLVSNDGSNAPTTSYTVSTVSVSSNVINLTVNGTFAGTAIRVLFPVIRGSVNASALGGLRTKTLTFGQTDDFLSSSVANVNRLQLSKSDIYRVVKIYMASTGYVASWNATIQTSAIDVTQRYVMDNGQRDCFYDIGVLTLKDGYPIPSGSIRVFYDYFEHGSGDYFARSSYNPLTNPYENIPTYNSRNLGDYLDFRSKIDPTTGNLSNAAPPRYNTFFNADISYYLGRKEMIFLDQTGTFFHTSGAPDTNPVLPKVAENNGCINLYNLTLSPYTNSSQYPDVGVERFDNRRYTMRDIGRIEKRVGNLEETTALSLLETKSAALQIRDALDPTLERYKTGFFVDSFKDNSNAENDGDARFSLDTLAQTMQTNISYQSIPLIEKTNYVSATYTSSELTALAVARTQDNYQVTGGLLTLNYTTATMISQALATTSIAVAPFLTATFIGSLVVRPDTDIYEDVTMVNQVVSFSSNLTAAALNKAVADLRAWWSRPYHVDTQVVNVYLDTTRTATLIPWCRANTILLKVVGMMPNTKLYTFFDDTPIEPYMSGAVKLTFDAMPFLDVDNQRAAANSEWPRWRQLYVSADVQEVTRCYTVRVGRRGWAWAYDYGWFHRTFKPLDFETSIPSSATRDAFRLALGAGPVVYYYEGSTCVGSGVIAHQIGNKCYLVNARGKLASNYIRTNGSVDYSVGNFYVSINNSELRKVYAKATVSNALTQDSLGNIYTDEFGTALALLDLPNTDTTRFITGKKPVIMTDSSTNDPDNWTSRAEASYTVQGFDVLITNNYSATQSYVLRPYDPIAQTFVVPDQYMNGAFITDIDVFFQAKPALEKAPVSLELRTCDSTGRPSGVEMVPGTAVTMYPDDISIDATYGQTPTKFTFKQPVYLQPGKNYAFVLRSDTKNYRVWMATLGKQDVYNTNQTYTTNYTLGSLFKSQDGTLWTEDQLSDLKFNISRAVFNTATQGATFRVVNHSLETAQLPGNPLLFTHGSNKIRVGQKNHGFASGDTTRLYSAYYAAQFAINNTTTLNGIPVGEIFGAYTSGSSISYRPADSDPRQYISDVTLDTYTITVSSVANLGAAASTGLTQLTGGGADIYGNSNILYHIVKPSARVLTFQPTTLSLTGQLMRGFNYDTDSQAPPVPYTWFTKSLNINNYNILDTSCIILASTNSYDRADTSLSVTAGGISQLWTDSFIGTFNLTTTDDAVSPAVDLTNMYMDLTTHRIDNPSYTSRLGNVLPAIGSTSTILVIDTQVSGNTTVSFDGNFKQINTTTDNLFQNIVPGRYITVSGSTVVGNTYTSLGLLVTAVSLGGRQITVSGTLATAAAGDSITIRQYNDFTEEFTNLNAAAEGKYISTIVNLKNPASQLKLIVESCVPSAADFDIYYKTGAAGADFTTINWVRYVAPLQTNQLSSYATIAKSDQRGVYTDVTFNISNYDSTYTPVDITPFTALQVKIVMRSSSAARIPQFRNLRVIAHA